MSDKERIEKLEAALERAAQQFDKFAEAAQTWICATAGAAAYAVHFAELEAAFCRLALTGKGAPSPKGEKEG
jgi:hypothetical protein